MGSPTRCRTANTIWTVREALTRAMIEERPAIEVLFRTYDMALRKAGFLAMGGQIIDVTIVAAPKQRNTDGEKAEIKAGRIPEAAPLGDRKRHDPDGGIRALVIPTQVEVLKLRHCPQETGMQPTRRSNMPSSASALGRVSATHTGTNADQLISREVRWQSTHRSTGPCRCSTQPNLRL